MLSTQRSELGKWICGDGAQKSMPLIAKAMQKAFVAKRFGDQSRVDYEWWMSCENFSDCDKRPVRPNKIDDFAPEFLQDVNSTVVKSGRESLISLGEACVYVDVLRTNPGSVAIFAQAIGLIDRWKEWQQAVFHSMVSSIIPIYSTFNGSERGVGFTDHNFMGAVFVSVERQSPYPDIALNISIAHELGHLALMLYQFSGNMLNGTQEWVYSGVRKVERPALMSLHAAVALSYMISSSRSLVSPRNSTGKNAYIQALINEYESSLKAGLAALRSLNKSFLCEEIFSDLALQLQD